MADNKEGGGGKPSSDAEKRSSARAKAEARRRRILEASDDRMGFVSGELSAKPTSDAAADGGDGGGGDGDAPAAAPAAEKPAASGASKYAQARRKRFQKKKAAAAKPDDAAAAGGGGAAAGAAAGAAKPETEEAAASSAKAGTETTASSAAAAADDNDGTTAAGGGAETKKYMGVAKMRRKMLVEKKRQKEEEGGGGEGPATGERRSASGRKMGAPPSLSTVARGTVRQRKGPIMLNLLTVLTLFLAGYGIGVQNSAGVGSGGRNERILTVETALSPVENGIGAFSLLRAAGTGVDEGGASAKAKDARERLLDESESAELQDDGAVHGDEFGDEDGAAASATGEEKPKGADADGRVPNIDLLFRVDLDEVTAGPGILMGAARLAVRFHRFIMYLILVLPMSVVTSILALPQALMASPPVLLFLSVVIRCVGRDILGAELPDVNELIGQDSEEGKGDILTTIVKTVKAQASATFPKMVAVFTVVKDAKSDMYVILCGLLVGLVIPVRLGGAPGGEEL